MFPGQVSMAILTCVCMVIRSFLGLIENQDDLSHKVRLCDYGVRCLSGLSEHPLP